MLSRQLPSARQQQESPQIGGFLVVEEGRDAEELTGFDKIASV
jgi:hypothetical protein